MGGGLIAVASPTIGGDVAPPLPMRIENICPADSCYFGNWVAARPIVAFKAEGDVRNKVFTIQAGEGFLALTGHLHTFKPAKAQIMESFSDPPDSHNPFYRFAKGSYVYILAPRGDDFYDVWYHGRRRGAKFPMAKAKYFMPGRDMAKLLEDGRWNWWVLARNGTGKLGWLRFPGILTGEVQGLGEHPPGWRRSW